MRFLFIYNIILKKCKGYRHIAGQKILTIISESGILIFVNMISVLLARLRSICGLVKDTNTLLEEKIVTQVNDFFMEAHKGLLLPQSEIKKDQL